MSGAGSERERPWNIYTASDPNPPQLADSPPHRDLDKPMNASSFGFVATAILISMFLIMAIFEHLFKPTQPDPHAPPSSSMHKPPITSEPDTALSMSGFSVMMPGQRAPTHIAKLAPFPAPCSREGVIWPKHDHHHHQQQQQLQASPT